MIEPEAVPEDGSRSEGVTYPGDEAYWTARYRSRHGRRAGSGSAGRLMQYKVETVNDVIRKLVVDSIVDLGCGDGEFARLLDLREGEYTVTYEGFDLSRSAVRRCYEGAQNPAVYDRGGFGLYVPGMFARPRAEMALSLDVLQHITEPPAYRMYMHDLFTAAARVVVVYAPHMPMRPSDPAHIYMREWLCDVPRSWHLALKLDNPYPFDPEKPDETSHSDFYFFTNQKP